MHPLALSATTKQTLHEPIQQLLEAGYITDFSDLFGLTVEQLVSLERFGTKSAENLVAAIAAAPGRSRMGVLGSVNRPCGVSPRSDAGRSANRSST